MNLLLDTHVWIWSQIEPVRLGPKTRTLLTSSAHQNHVCTISTLEIARLVSTTAIRLSISLDDWVAQALRALEARTVEVSHAIAAEAYRLPDPFHKDPADRLLVAACRRPGWALVTADERILRFDGVRSRDARK